MSLVAEGTKSVGPRLILPKIIYKQSQGKIVEARVRPEESSVHSTISQIISKVNGLSRSENDPAALRCIVKDLVELSAQCRKNQQIAMTVCKPEDNIRLMRLKIKSMQADLQFRREQIMKLQGKVKQLEEESRSKSCSKLQLVSCRSQDVFPFGVRVQNNESALLNSIKGSSSEYGIDHLAKKLVGSQMLQQNALVENKGTNSKPKPRLKSPREVLKQRTNSLTPKLDSTKTKDLQDRLLNMNDDKNRQIEQLRQQLIEARQQHSKTVAELEGKLKQAKKLSKIYRKECKQLTAKAVFSELSHYQQANGQFDF